MLMSEPYRCLIYVIWSQPKRRHYHNLGFFYLPNALMAKMWSHCQHILFLNIFAVFSNLLWNGYLVFNWNLQLIAESSRWLISYFLHPILFDHLTINSCPKLLVHLLNQDRKNMYVSHFTCTTNSI